MPEFPVRYASSLARTLGAQPGTSSAATSLTPGASQTKGSAVELIAATEFDASWVLVDFTKSGGNGAFLVDLLVGSAPEEVIIPDMYFHTRVGSGWGPFLFPVSIPRGSRVSARCAANHSGNIDIAVTLFTGSILAVGGGPPVVCYPGASFTQVLVPGHTTTPDTDGSVVEIVESTVRDHNWLVLAARAGDSVLTASTSWRLNIGIGGSPEAVLIPDLHYSADTVTDHPFNGVMAFPVSVPAGSRITAWQRSSVATAGDRDITLKLYGAG